MLHHLSGNSFSRLWLWVLLKWCFFFLLGLQMLLLVSHGFSAVMPLLCSWLDSIGALYSGYETKAKVPFISLPLQRLLCNPLLAHSCLWTTGSGLWGSLIAYCPTRNVSSLSPLPLGQNVCWTSTCRRLPGQLRGCTDRGEIPCCWLSLRWHGEARGQNCWMLFQIPGNIPAALLFDK